MDNDTMQSNADIFAMFYVYIRADPKVFQTLMSELMWF